MDSLTFVGTATTVLRLGGFTLLTDPNFIRKGQRAYLGRGLWTRRLTDPSMRPDELPVLDAVVLSHLHGDHWDRVARRELDREPPVLTTTHAAPRPRRAGAVPPARRPLGPGRAPRAGPGAAGPHHDPRGAPTAPAGVRRRRAGHVAGAHAR